MRIKLDSLTIGLAWFAGVHSAPAQPTLNIAQPSDQVVLFWATNATNYILQGTTDLASPDWVWASDALPATSGSQTAVAVASDSPARFFRLYQINTTSDGMALIPAGSFTIGNLIGDGDITDADPADVYVSAFYMDVNLVSSNQWQPVYSYATNHGYGFDPGDGSGKAGNQPVQTVDWYDCVKWSNARSEMAGLTPVYYTDATFTNIYTNGQVLNPYVNWAANGYRLPTEAEWEKAARGGLSGLRFPWGDTISESQANYPGDPPGDLSYDLGPAVINPIALMGGLPYTSPVGYFLANGYGLYDMAGNVEEWCWDWYAGPPYPAGSPYLGGTDPRGPASSPYNYRILRGGNWLEDARVSRCANRDFNGPAAIYQTIGFRCVRAQ